MALLAGAGASALLGSAIGAGTSLLGGKIASNTAGSSKGRQFSADFAKWELSERRKDERDRYGRIVAGAKAAGLHPLFALGAGGGSSGTSVSVPGQAPTGSHLGEGIARAGEQVARGLSAAGTAGQAAELHRLAMARGGVALERDQIELLKSASELKRMEQLSLIGRAPLWPAGVQEGGESATYPAGTKRGVALAATPITSTSRRSSPLWMEAKGPHGRERMMSPDLNMDEINQAIWAFERLQKAVTGLLPWSQRKVWPRRSVRSLRKQPRSGGGGY